MADLQWWRLLILSTLDNPRAMSMSIDWASNALPQTFDFEITTDASSKI